jgi:hypothetical protein
MEPAFGKELLRKMSHKTNWFLVAVLIVLAGVLGLSVINAQQPIAANTRPFEPVEELQYEAEFNRSLLRGLNIADFKFRSSRTPNVDKDNGSKPGSLVFRAEVLSKGFFTRLFNLKFHEQVESTVDANTLTLQRTTIRDEQGKRVRETETTYDRAKGKMAWTRRDPNNPAAEPNRALVDFSGQLQDILSAIYFIRTQPLHLGKSFEVFIGDGGKVYRVPIQVLEKKKMKTVLGRVTAFRVEPDLFGPDSLIDDEKGQFTLWITDDDRHIPVTARIKTDYGTFDIKLKRAVYN